MLLRVEAIVRDEKYEDVKAALDAIGVNGFTVSQVMGCGIEAVESLVARGKKGLAAALGPQRGALGFGGEDE